MRDKLQKCIYMSILFVLISNSAYALTNFSKATIVVIDESNKPVEGAYTGITFETNTGQGTKVSTNDGSTDSEGKFTATGSCNGHIAYGAKKEGFYDSYYSYDFKGKNAFGWEPWNPELKIVLRKIENPVPMYARNTRMSKIEIPAIGKDIGFDLIKFDWVTPYGNGTNADFVFNLKKESKGKKDFDYRVLMYFPNKYDGLIPVEENLQYGSQLKLPKVAPLDGYVDRKELYVKRGLNLAETSSKRNMNYIFRVRSEEEKGRFKRGLYGKIIGDFEIGTKSKGTANIEFIYYLNPDYTRNLEFDPKRNLFGTLPDLERVTEP